MALAKTCFFLMLALSFFLMRVESKVKFKKNAYSGIVIAINPSIPENPTLIDALKSAWTNASRVLYQATRYRSYFSKITILVPTTWKNGHYNPSNGETYKKAEVLVAYENPGYGEVPYTLQYGQCGEKGTYIHITPNYMLDETFVRDYGPRGKTIVHEWSHLRWGVFDETVTNGYDPFYLPITGKPEANRCPLFIRGDNYYVDWTAMTYRSCNIDSQTLLPEDGCQFFPNVYKSPDPASSMMSYEYLDSVYTFCDDDTSDPGTLHNHDAPNEHNRLCNLRSTWDVITTSADFAYENNPPNPEISNIDPDIEVVQPQSYQRYVLVLDVSGSMNDGTRLLMMQQGASTFIMQAVSQGSQVGIVQFSSTAKTLSDMTTINNYADRLALNDKLPDSADGGTSIGSGVRKAIEVLQKGGQSSTGGILIVLSDGQENEDPTLSDVYNEIIDAGVIVNSIVFTEEADPMLETIASDTGGIWYFSDEDTYNGTTASLTNAFISLAKVDDGNVYRETFQIYSSSFTVSKSGNQVIGRIVIDNTVGNGTVFSFTWSQYSIPLEVTLTAPSGCNYANANVQNECVKDYSPRTDKSLKLMEFPIDATAEMGVWTYYVSPGGNYDQNVIVTCVSMASDIDVQPIAVESGMGQVEAADGEAIVVYAQVSMGYAPVLNADVTARIERPTGVPVTIKLKDKGAAPDVRKKDGIYSRYFTQYNGPGRYSVQVSITGVDGQTTTSATNQYSKAAKNLGTIDSSGKLTLNPNGAPVTAQQTSTGEFSRVSSSGGFSYTGRAGTADIFAPSKIIDLAARQEDVTNANSGIEIRFTAPGDDLDEGTAAGYEIRYAYSTTASLLADFQSNPLINQTDVISGNILQPQEAGSDEVFVFTLPDLPTYLSTFTVGVAVRAYDEARNYAETSNVVSVNYFIDSPAQPVDDNAELIVMIIFICISCILLVVVGGLLWKIQKMKKESKAKQGNTALSTVTTKKRAKIGPNHPSA